MINKQEIRPFLKKKQDLEFIKNENEFNKLSSKEKSDLKKINETTFQGLKEYVHDINLDFKIAEKYEIGQLLYHPTELFFTSYVKGLNKSHRFLVYSNNMDDLSKKEEVINEIKTIGLNKSNIVECFKIVDIYKIGEKTQITLINYPPKCEIILKDEVTEFEKDIINKSRRSFEKSIKTEPFSELFGRWNKLFNEPIGIRDFNYRHRFYSKNSMIAYLDILDNISCDFGMDATLDFIHDNDMSSLINVYDENVDEILRVNNTSSNENIEKEIFDCVISLESIVKEGISVSKTLGPSFKEDMIGLSDTEKAIKLNEAFEDMGNEFNGVIDVKDENGNQLLPILSLLDVRESYLFLYDLIGDWDLSGLPGYNKNKIELALENNDEKFISDFLKSNEADITQLVIKRLNGKLI